MTELTHRDLELKLDTLDNKFDAQHAELIREIGELKVLVATTTTAHSTSIGAHEKRIEKIEDREWRVAGAITMGALSFLGTIALLIITLV